MFSIKYINNRYCTTGRTIFIFILLVLALGHFDQPTTVTPKDSALPPNGSAVATKDSAMEVTTVLPPFIITICNGGEEYLMTSFSRQLSQIEVLLKSAISLTKATLRFVVVTNSEKVFSQIQSIPMSWPESYSSRLVLESRSVWYPAGRENMRDLLRPCASARLFLPESLLDIDLAVYVDTDTLFLHPPEHLLQIIYQFDESQAAGLAQTTSRYVNRKKSIPFPLPTGVNTGVMLMNFTRLRNLPGGGWSGATLKAFDKYRKKLSTTVTNDIVNIALTKAVFEAWLEHPVGRPLSELLSSIELKINTTETEFESCKHFKFMLTESLRKLI